MNAATLRNALRSAADPQDLQTAIDRFAVPVLVTDRHGRYIAVNRAACELTGYTEPELLNKALHDLTGASDAGVEEVLWRAFLEQGYQTGEYTLARRDGTTVLVTYEALAHVLPGYHASILREVAPPAGGSPSSSANS